MRDPAANKLVRRALVEIDIGLESPALLAGPRIQRDDIIEGRAINETVVDEDRRRFGHGAAHAIGFRCQVARAVSPCHLEFVDIVGRDLLRGTVPMPAGVIAVGWPAVAGQSDGTVMCWRYSDDIERVRTAEIAVARSTEDRCGNRGGDSQN